MGGGKLVLFKFICVGGGRGRGAGHVKIVGSKFILNLCCPLDKLLSPWPISTTEVDTCTLHYIEK